MCCGGNIIQAVAHGAIGMTKATLGLDEVSPEVHQMRAGACKGCEHNRPNNIINLAKLDRMRVCEKCSCIIWGKIRVRSEACPIGKWPALTPVE